MNPQLGDVSYVPVFIIKKCHFLVGDARLLMQPMKMMRLGSIGNLYQTFALALKAGTQNNGRPFCRVFVFIVIIHSLIPTNDQMVQTKMSPIRLIRLGSHRSLNGMSTSL